MNSIEIHVKNAPKGPVAQPSPPLCPSANSVARLKMPISMRPAKGHEPRYGCSTFLVHPPAQSNQNQQQVTTVSTKSILTAAKHREWPCGARENFSYSASSGSAGRNGPRESSSPTSTPRRVPAPWSPHGKISPGKKERSATEN